MTQFPPSLLPRLVPDQLPAQNIVLFSAKRMTPSYVSSEASSKCQSEKTWLRAQHTIKEVRFGNKEPFSTLRQPSCPQAAALPPSATASGPTMHPCAATSSIASVTLPQSPRAPGTETADTVRLAHVVYKAAQEAGLLKSCWRWMACARSGAINVSSE